MWCRVVLVSVKEYLEEPDQCRMYVRARSGAKTGVVEQSIPIESNASVLLS